ncbi:S9 family peptidase [candidate division KSB1 bacterium]
MMRRVSLCFLILLVLSATVFAQNKRAITAEDYYRIKNVGSPVISPDNNFVAFTVQTVREKDNDRISRIWMIDLRSGEVYPFTSPEHNSTSPRWSEDGKHLIFNSNRGTQNRTWHISMESGGGEAFFMEDYKAKPNNLSPDENYVLFTKSVGDRPAEEPETRRDDKFDGRIIEHRTYKRNGAGFVPPPRPYRGGITQVFKRTNAEKSDTLQLTFGDLPKGSPAWSPDGKNIVYTENPLQYDEQNRPLEFLDRKFGNEVFVISADVGTPKKLNIPDGSARSFNFSNKSNRFFYTHSKGQYEESFSYIYDLDTDRSIQLGKDWIYGIGGVTWSQDDEWLYFTGTIEGSSHLCRIRSDGSGQVEQITEGLVQNGSFQFDEDMKFMVYTKTHQTLPRELFMANIDGTNEKQLTFINKDFLDEVYLNPVHNHKIEGIHGLTVEGWIMEPYNYDPNKKYPLVLQIHGGPHSRYGNTFFHQFNVLAGEEMFVLYTNPRGSSGYGYEFTYITREKWGVDDYDDYMRFVDFSIENYPIDVNKLGVAGGSYGGFMTNWITTQTDRFAAASASRTIVNWWSFFGNSDAQGLIVSDFGFGLPWDKKVAENMWKYSPIAYVQNVTTPTLLIQSEEDYRTPMGEAEQWFQALKILKVPVRFVRYPRETHELSRSGEPQHLVHRLNEIRSWFVKYLNN